MQLVKPDFNLLTADCLRPTQTAKELLELIQSAGLQLFPDAQQLKSAQLQRKEEVFCYEQSEGGTPQKKCNQQIQRLKINQDFFYSFKDLAGQEPSHPIVPASHQSNINFTEDIQQTPQKKPTQSIFYYEEKPTIVIRNVYRSQALKQEKFSFCNFVDNLEYKASTVANWQQIQRYELYRSKRKGLTEDLEEIGLKIQEAQQDLESEGQMFDEELPYMKPQKRSKEKIDRFLSRVSQWYEQKENRIERIKNRLHAEEYKECSFTPKISQKSVQIFEQREKLNIPRHSHQYCHSSRKSLQKTPSKGQLLTSKRSMPQSQLQQLQKQNARLKFNRDRSWILFQKKQERLFEV